ncbi:MAG: DUF1848 domain-containing protein [Clostridiaceae bacterium]
MILSVSRRTDIPAFYTEWFINRVRQGFLYVRNPFNDNQISKINISPDNVDCIVFWSKNPEPIINHLKELDDKGYKYYFQFTITPYSDDLEVNIKNKEDIINTFIRLSDKIGKERVILRYDPIIITDKYDYDFHFKAFENICFRLQNHTEKVIISFLDSYKKVSGNTKGINIKEIKTEDMRYIAGSFAKIAEKYNLPVETCAEAIDLSEFGIGHGKCIDGDLIERITGYKIINKNKRDGNREDCRCMKCIDIGQYNTCIHNCVYCYANENKKTAINNYRLHNADSPILSGEYSENQINERKDINSFKIKQTSFFDL